MIFATEGQYYMDLSRLIRARKYNKIECEYSWWRPLTPVEGTKEEVYFIEVVFPDYQGTVRYTDEKVRDSDYERLLKEVEI